MASFKEINATGLEMLESLRDAEARAHYRGALDNLGGIPGITSDEIGQLLNNYGLACRYSGDLVEAERAYQQALARYKASPNPPLHEMLPALSNLGRLAMARNENEAASEYFTEALDCGKSLIESASPFFNPPLFAQLLHDIAEILCRKGMFQEALQNLHDALEIRTKALPKGHFDIAMNLRMLGDVYFTLRDAAQARAFYERALPLLEQVGEVGDAAMKDVESQLRALG